MFILLLLLLMGGGGGAEIFVNPPVPIVNGRSLRLDINPGDGQGRTRFHVDRVIACSAIDMPFFEYDAHEPGTSGCNSSGYESYEIYSSAIASNPAGSLASKFRVRLKQNTLLMRRHLIDRRAPLVRLQVHLSFGGGGGKTEIVQTVYYRVDELALPIDSGGDANQTGRFVSGSGKNVFGSAIADDGMDDERQYTGVSSSDRDPLWYTQTLGLMFIFAFGAGVALIIWYRVSKKSSKHSRGGGDSYQQNHYNTIASFINKASVIGFFSTTTTTATTDARSQADAKKSFV